MKVSTKGRYALRIMIDLAQNSDGGPVSLKEIANRQGVSAKYLELIVSTLNKAGFVKSTRGKAGGYRLARAAEEYSVGSILKLTEGNLAPVACLESGENSCIRAAECVALPMWQKLDGIIDDYLEGVNLMDLINQEKGCL
ncbi:MAG: RrF2 family transcriptional regulator [Eubacteriales bacterium]